MKAFKIFIPTEGGVKMDYNGTVTLNLKADTSWLLSSDILSESRVTLNLGDIRPSVELYKKVYVVTVEEIAGPNAGEHQREYYERIIREREEEEMKNAGLSPSLTRRLKTVN